MCVVHYTSLFKSVNGVWSDLQFESLNMECFQNADEHFHGGIRSSIFDPGNIRVGQFAACRKFCLTQAGANPRPLNCLTNTDESKVCTLAHFVEYNTTIFGPFRQFVTQLFMHHRSVVHK